MANLGVKQKLFWRLRAGERRFLLIVGDLFSSYLALFLALVFWARASNEWLQFSLQFLLERPPFWFYLLPLLWLVLLSGMYDIRRASNMMETIGGIAMAALLSATVYMFVFFLSEPGALPRLGVAIFFIGSAVLTLIWRFLYIQIFTAPTFLRRVLIVGAGNAGKTLVKITKNIWPLPFYLVGLIDDDSEKIGTEIEGYPVISGSQNVLTLIEEHEITDVIFAISGDLNPELLTSLITAEERGIEVTTLPVIYEELLGRVPIYLLQSDWLLRSFVDQVHVDRIYELSKRLLDLIFGFLGSVAFILSLPFVGLGILLESKGPIIYSQVRLGKNGKEYKIYKYRSMYADAEIDGHARPASENDDRVTKIGRLLRKSHLDELPQSINIFLGEMSIVGPRAERPEIVQELQKEIPFYRARLFVKPGLTGWAQVNYGYASGVEQNAIKLEYDLYYIKHRNLMLDISIMFQTAGAVVGLKGR